MNEKTRTKVKKADDPRALCDSFIMGHDDKYLINLENLKVVYFIISTMCASQEFGSLCFEHISWKLTNNWCRLLLLEISHVVIIIIDTFYAKC